MSTVRIVEFILRRVTEGFEFRSDLPEKWRWECDEEKITPFTT